MLMKMRSKMQNQKGFTLVELMVVVVILGILVAIAVPVYNNVSNTAKAKADAANVRILNGALSQYAATKDLDLTNATDIASEPDITSYIQEVPDSPYGTTTGTSVKFKGYNYTGPAGGGAAAFYSSPNENKWKS